MTGSGGHPWKQVWPRIKSGLAISVRRRAASASSNSSRSAKVRLAIVSLLSFALTEAAYAGMLEWTSIDYRLSLYLVIVTLALGKVVASKHWAFAR